MAQRSRSYPTVVTGFGMVSTGLRANVADLPHLEGHGTRFEVLLGDIHTLNAQQSVFTASKQEVSKKLQAALQEASTLADFLRTGIREHYGKDSEKLVEFGMQPFRGRPRSPKQPPDPTPTPDSVQ